MLLAPYNNSMRLGQGFNSYTQQICLDRAVRPDPNGTSTEKDREDIKLSEGIRLGGGSGGKKTEDKYEKKKDESSGQGSTKGTGGAASSSAVKVQAKDESVSDVKDAGTGKKEKTTKEKEAATVADKAKAGEAKAGEAKAGEAKAGEANADEAKADETKGGKKTKEGGDKKKKDPKKLIEVAGDTNKAVEDAVRQAAEDHANRQKENDKELALTRNEVIRGADGDGKPIVVPKWAVPQIVTYSSRFVDKLSDVTDAMNISGSVSIKTAMIGGKANGSYVDSDKFKSSDINFHLQVRVTNQIHNAPNYTLFNDLPIDPSQFTEVYGDSFISGWEEGGELNAIISVKVLDKSKIFEIKAGLEAELSTSAIAGEVKGYFELTKNNLSKSTETTIAVNWSGGGSIKDPAQDWSITTLKKAAAAFPDFVAVIPQRTHAILTKYTALEDFHKKNQKFSPLSYDNAGVYTGALLDAYMDFKNMWKQISLATTELEGNRATIELGQPSEETKELARVRAAKLANTDPKALPSNGSEKQSNQLNITSGSEEMTGILTEGKDVTSFKVFPASFAGLIQARKICRFEMAKIVNEVDLVAKEPLLATDTRRDTYFLHPLVFKQLLPVVRSLSPEDRALGVRNPSAEVILGYLQPKEDDRNLPQLYELPKHLREYHPTLQKSIARLKNRAHDYRVAGVAGKTQANGGLNKVRQPEFFNDLERLDATYRPVTLSIWCQDQKLVGVNITYSNALQIGHGKTEDDPTRSINLESDGSEAINEIAIGHNASFELQSVTVATSNTKLVTTTITENDREREVPGPESKTGETLFFTTPDESSWSLRGFFGFTVAGSLVSLGVVWGKDSFVPVPMSAIHPALCTHFISLSEGHRKFITETVDQYPQFLGEFRMGDFVWTGEKETTKTEPADITKIETAEISKTEPAVTYFNSLKDIDIGWKIKALGFSATDKILQSIKVLYTNGEESTYGEWNEDKSWRVDVDGHVVVARITAGRSKVDEQRYIDTVEFVRGDETGQVPSWPLDSATIRYLADKKGRVVHDVSSVVETAPKIGRGVWSVKGFYGDVMGGSITRLGVVWGKSH